MSLIKSSNKLSNLYKQMMKFAVDNDYDDWDADCDYFSWSDYSIGEEAAELFKLLNKAHEDKREVFQITDEDRNVILFVGTEAECIVRLKAEFQQMKDDVAANEEANAEAQEQREEEQAQYIEAEIARLKKQLKKLNKDQGEN